MGQQNRHLPMKRGNAVDEARRGWLGQCEFSNFTSVVLLDLYRITYHNKLLPHREDFFRERACVIAQKCHLRKITECSDHR